MEQRAPANAVELIDIGSSDDDNEPQIISPNPSVSTIPTSPYGHVLQATSSTLNQATTSCVSVDDAVILDCLGVEFGCFRFRPLPGVKHAYRICLERIHFRLAVLSNPSLYITFSILQQHIVKITMEMVRNLCHCTVFFDDLATNTIMEEMFRRNPNDCYDHSGIGAPVPVITFVLRDVLNPEDHARITSMFGTRFQASEKYLMQFSKTELRPTSKDDKIIITYPGGAQSGGFVIRVNDYKCLDDGAYLNDVMIDFYLKYFVDNILLAENRPRTHVFSSFFYQNIAPSPNENPGLENSKGRHKKVSKWTKHVNIFEKDFIIIPINLHQHWFVAIVCFPGLALITESQTPILNRAAGQSGGVRELPCILIFDSMPQDRGDVFTPILNYLTHEYEAKIGETFQFSTNNMGVDTVVVPAQVNSWNCGLFLLEYVERFFTHPIKDFSIPILGLENWFNQSCISNKRIEISLIIKDLINQDEVVLPKLFETGQLIFSDLFQFIE
ncbi:sentrin-specific protease 6-like [Trichogramma pretiosum]|uniref:sentrin-specific protease 6-like n=1 Tax=Trichogramma pretiosum TaxID=7493 RepID=UPI0006C9C3B3|nr:sentrin-specific protease 6-like [Trichogramma pretiosum]